MEVSREDLRAVGRRALEKKGFAVTVQSTVGARSGSRLEASKDGKLINVGIRTSLRREAGFSQNDDGKWSGLPSVDVVLVVVPSLSPGAADVYCYYARKLIKLYEKCIANTKQPEKTKYGVYIAIDDQLPKKSKSIGKGLGRQAQWHMTLPILGAQRPTNTNWDLLIDRFTEDAAALVGTDPLNIAVEVRFIHQRNAKADSAADAAETKRNRRARGVS